MSQAQQHLNATVSQQAQQNDTVQFDLIDYFLVLVNHKRLVLLGSFIPAVVAGVFFFFLPRDYTLSYTYRMTRGETDLMILNDRFYSRDNTQTLQKTFTQQGLDKYADRFSAAERRGALAELVCFEILPPLFSTDGKSFEQLQKRQEAAGSLLVIHINAADTDTLGRVAAVYRDNFEQTIPLLDEKEEIVRRIVSLKESLASIEANRYLLELDLEHKKNTLRNLQATATQPDPDIAGQVVLQFDAAGDNRAFLPLPYQLQAVRTEIVNLDETLRANRERYQYDTDMLAFNQLLLDTLNVAGGPVNTVDRFKEFLGLLANRYTKEPDQMKDALQAYRKRVDNISATYRPLAENPMIRASAKGTVKIIGIVLIAALIVSVFGAFLQEGFYRKTHSGRQH